MKRILLQLCFTLGIFIYIALLGNRSGAPAGRTGAPEENTCGTSSCHNTDPNMGSATLNLSLNEDQTTYQLDAIHKVTIAIDNPQNVGRNGFEIVALDAQDNNIGEWILAGNDKRERNGSGRNYITHTTEGSVQTTWEMDWQAPAEDVGAITFYVAAIDANDNGGRTGDDLYVTSLSTEAVITSSVKTISSLVGASIFPNPVIDQLNLEFDLASNTYLTGTIYNAAGQRISSLFQETVSAGTTIQSFFIPHNMTSGHYFMELSSIDGAVTSIPFIKK